MHRRTALITAASIVAVVLTGATAVGANIGILSSASASSVGDLTAVAQVETVEPVSTISTGDPTVTATVGAAESMVTTSQVFQADAAGLVEVQFGSDHVRLGAVGATSGWTWSSSQRGDTELVVRFLSDDGDEFEFSAELLPDGTLSAKVDENIVQTIQGTAQVITVHEQAPAPTAPVATAQPAATVSATTAAASPSPVAPAPTATSGSGSSNSSFDDDDDDDEIEFEDEHEDEREDEQEDEREDEQEYEGADDDD